MRTRRSTWLAVLIGGGIAFQFLGCTPEGLVSLFGNFNPCGTVLNCNPQTFLFAREGIDGPGVRVDVDPFCSFPPFCGPGTDPVFGTVLGGP